MEGAVAGAAGGAGGAGGAVGAGDTGDLANRLTSVISEQKVDMQNQLKFQKESSALNMQFQMESAANARRDALANTMASASQRITQAIR